MCGGRVIKHWQVCYDFPHGGSSSLLNVRWSNQSCSCLCSMQCIHVHLLGFHWIHSHGAKCDCVKQFTFRKIMSRRPLDFWNSRSNPPSVLPPTCPSYTGELQTMRLFTISRLKLTPQFPNFVMSLSGSVLSKETERGSNNIRLSAGVWGTETDRQTDRDGTVKEKEEEEETEAWYRTVPSVPSRNQLNVLI